MTDQRTSSRAALLIRKIVSSCCVVALCMSVMACLSSHRPLPVKLDPVPKRQGLIYVFYGTGNTFDPKAEKSAHSSEFRILQRLLEEQAGFAVAIGSSTPPAKGIYLTAYRTSHDVSRAAKFFCTVSFMTVTVLPCYSDRHTTVTANVYIDNKLRKSYEYDMEERQIQWIGLLPLFWLNDFTTQYGQSFEATAYRFISDARIDGYLYD